MLEDACLLGDAPFLANLFDVDAVLLTRGTSQLRGRTAIAKVIIDQLRDDGSYVGAPCLSSALFAVQQKACLRCSERARKVPSWRWS